MLLGNFSDKVLVQNFLNGDNKSFEVLLSRHKSSIWYY